MGWLSPNSRYLTPERYCQLSLPCNLTNTPPAKEKWSQPMGRTKLRASGHREFLAQATSLHNQGKCKQPYTANHTPNTCVQEQRGRHGGYSLGARWLCVLGFTLMELASSPTWRQERGTGHGHSHSHSNRDESHHPSPHLSSHHLQRPRLST